MRNTLLTLLCYKSGPGNPGCRRLSAGEPPERRPWPGSFFCKTVVPIGWILLAYAALAQQVVTPTPEQAGSPRGENTGDYNVMESFENGYRFAVLDGSVGTYRSDVNYGNGIRLLSGNLSVNSRDGHGRWFDQIVLTTIGLGNDPYQSVTLRVEKNKLYRYDMLWRLDDYFNPGLPVAGGLHDLVE